MPMLVHDSAVHIKKDVLYVFFCSIETSEISKGKQMKTAVGVYPLCIYTWHRCAFFFCGDGASCAIIYILNWRSLLLLLILDITVLPEPL